MRDNLFVRTLRNRFVPIVMVALLFGIAMICYDVMWVRPVYSVANHSNPEQKRHHNNRHKSISQSPYK